MKHQNVLSFALIIISFASIAEAAKTSFLRGGQGFIFPDHNSFVNPGQMARDSGFGLELQYGRQGTDYQSAAVSGAYSGKSWAFGVSGLREGADLGNGSDSVDTGLGIELGKRFTAGVRYTRGLSEGQVDDGEITGAINLNPGKGTGFSIGVAYTTTVNGFTNVAGAKAGVGYAGKNRNTNFEVNFEIPNIDDTATYVGGAFFTYGGAKSFYGGGGVEYESSGTTSAKARLGVLLGNKNPWDLSAFGTYSFEDGSDPLYGATLRAQF